MQRSFDLMVTEVAPATEWILVSVTTGGSSTLRGHAWRTLRGLGGVYVQQSVCLLPALPAPQRTVNRLVDRLRREGGEGRVLRLRLTEPEEERRLIEEFQRAREDEYAEFCSRVPAFVEEIEMERRRSRATYAEVEESEADLERLRRWLAKIRARDYFDARGAEAADAALAHCETLFFAFEAEAVNAETRDPTTNPGAEMSGAAGQASATRDDTREGTPAERRNARIAMHKET
jgi:hypothetical protein